MLDQVSQHPVAAGLHSDNSGKSPLQSSVQTDEPHC